MSKLRNIVSNKICAIVAHGKSIEELEKHIVDFKDFDLCWCGMNYFIPTENILKKVGKMFDVIFDSSLTENAKNYELNWRLPKLTEYLSRNYNNCFLTLSHNLPPVWQAVGKGEFATIFQNKIVYGEDLGFNTDQFCVSIPLFISCLVVEGAKAVIVFGMDANVNGVEGYYRPDLMIEDKKMAGHEKFFINVKGDAHNVNTSYIKVLDEICKSKTIKKPEIINVSPNSAITIFKKMNYNEVFKWLRSL